VCRAIEDARLAVVELVRAPTSPAARTKATFGVVQHQASWGAFVELPGADPPEKPSGSLRWLDDIEHQPSSRDHERRTQGASSRSLLKHGPRPETRRWPRAQSDPRRPPGIASFARARGHATGSTHRYPSTRAPRGHHVDRKLVTARVIRASGRSGAHGRIVHPGSKPPLLQHAPGDGPRFCSVDSQHVEGVAGDRTRAGRFRPPRVGSGSSRIRCCGVSGAG